MTTPRIFRLSVTCALLGACALPSVERAISPNDIGAGKTRLTNYASCLGQQPERTPGQISGAALVDEAEIASATASEVCVKVVVRAHTSADHPLSDYEVNLNGQRVMFDNEEVGYVDYKITGEREKASATFVSRNAFAELHVTEPTQEIYRVYERRATTCAPPSKVGKIALDLSYSQGTGKGSCGEAFNWTMR